MMTSKVVQGDYIVRARQRIVLFMLTPWQQTIVSKDLLVST